MSTHNPSDRGTMARMQEHARQAIERDLAENPDLDPRRRDPEEHARRVAERKERMAECARQAIDKALDEKPELFARLWAPNKHTNGGRAS